MIDSESESKLPKEESLHYFSSTPTQQCHTTCALGHIIDYTKPDITILCDICKCFLNVSELKAHKTYHNALQLYKFKEAPNTIEAMLKRRDLLIQRMQRLNISEDSYFKYVRTINDAFQIIKRTIEPYYYGDNSCIYDNREASYVQGLSFVPRNRLFLSIGICSNQNRQFKTDMEDAMKFIDCFGGNERFSYIGLFDGYNGKAASSLCREYFHDAILLEMAKLINEMNSGDADQSLINRLYTLMVNPIDDESNIKSIGDVYRSAYLKMDHLLSRGINEKSRVRWSGTSAFTAVIAANDHTDQLLDHIDSDDDDSDHKNKSPDSLGQIHVANCGNVEALGIRVGEAFLISQKHTLSSKRERERVLETGVKVSENDLIAGIMEPTRGLGNHGDKDIKKSVINTPFFSTYEIDPSLECIIIATEGLWQVLQYDVVVDIVTQCLPSHHIPAPSRIPTAIRSVLERYARSTMTTYSTTDDEDEISNCLNEILQLIEQENENDPGNAHLPFTFDRGVQCSEDEIHQEIWNSLPPQERLRLELAQTISERLVSAALLAQSKANISVICLLLPSAAV